MAGYVVSLVMQIARVCVIKLKEFVIMAAS